MSHPRRKSSDPKVDLKSDLAVSEISPARPYSSSHMNFLTTQLHYANLIAEVGKLGFVNVLGNKFNPSDYSGYLGEQALPGIMALDIVPTIGRSENINSGVNLAAKDIFTGIRRNNMGSIPYDPADVMLYMIAIDSILTMLAHIRRCFRVVEIYHWKNRYISDALIEAMGVTAFTLRGTFGDLVARYDMIVTKAQRLIYLRDFPLLAEHAMLFSEVYKDSEDERAQFYLPRPSCYYLMELLPESPKQVLTCKNIAYNPTRGMSNWLNDVETMINNIAYVNTYSNIAGQIEKAFGPNTATLPLSGDLSPLEPIYDKSFGWVLQNADPKPVSRDSLKIYESLDPDQNLGALICQPEGVGGLMLPYDATIYTSHDALSAEEVYQVLRWKPVRKSLNNPFDSNIIAGTDILEYCTVYYYNYLNDNLTLESKQLMSSVLLASSGPPDDVMSWEDEMERWFTIGLMTNFKWFPYLSILGKADPMVGTTTYVGEFGNIDNYMKVSNNQIALVQDVRQLEAFYMANITTVT